MMGEGPGAIFEGLTTVEPEFHPARQALNKAASLGAGITSPAIVGLETVGRATGMHKIGGAIADKLGLSTRDENTFTDLMKDVNKKQQAERRARRGASDISDERGVEGAVFVLGRQLAQSAEKDKRRFLTQIRDGSSFAGLDSARFMEAVMDRAESLEPGFTGLEGTDRDIRSLPSDVKQAILSQGAVVEARRLLESGLSSMTDLRRVYEEARLGISFPDFMELVHTDGQ